MIVIYYLRLRIVYKFSIIGAFIRLLPKFSAVLGLYSLTDGDNVSSVTGEDVPLNMFKFAAVKESLLFLSGLHFLHLSGFSSLKPVASSYGGVFLLADDPNPTLLDRFINLLFL